MRVVVIGPYPPTLDPRADAVLAEVRALRRAGHVVDVVSPEPSAAAHHARPDTVTGARRIGRVTRGADLVVVHEPPRRGRGPGGRLAARALDRALAGAVRVEWRGDAADPAATPAPGRTLAERVRRVRAGAPTLARSLVGAVRRR